MIIEVGTHLIESVPAITTVLSLLIGAVRVIPINGRLEILGARQGKNEPRITRSGHAIIPDGHSASVAWFLQRGGLQTSFNVIDQTDGNSTTSQATITGFTDNPLATLTGQKREFSYSRIILFKYIPHRSKKLVL